ncbi:MAG: copper chaperone PCu(A)C [Hydrogenophaga sp.]|uniref:copper chaperone PCu(A)C n=2 Tax=Hydrogenophaga sp. TaxID=1904254 RepID=UPI00271935F7|nr:copper chaperone PCu(A)C [Hydrogenophaga sp.]MDO9483372.1 copper chaperone PCu(A)C [Hydrogenophaga sp.]MDP3345937.1 copper chaperone PCu(A)C [Hydrogenophaga sp.]
MNRRFMLLGLLGFGLVEPVLAHDFKAGELRVDHPYATPSAPGLKTGAVYFRAIRNRGAQNDRLLSASTPVAARVEIHRMQMDGDVMRMRAVDAVDLPAKSEVKLRHGAQDGHHLMLFELNAPLKDGDRFPVTLRFERAGTHAVMVWVQTPRRIGTASPTSEHRH